MIADISKFRSNSWNESPKQARSSHVWTPLLPMGIRFPTLTWTNSYSNSSCISHVDSVSANLPGLTVFLLDYNTILCIGEPYGSRLFNLVQHPCSSMYYNQFGPTFTHARNCTPWTGTDISPCLVTENHRLNFEIMCVSVHRVPFLDFRRMRKLPKWKPTSETSKRQFVRKSTPWRWPTPGWRRELTGPTWRFAETR